MEGHVNGRSFYKSLIYVANVNIVICEIDTDALKYSS